jgi:hypothetical protein
MSPAYKFVVDDRVLEIFAGSTRRQREELLRIWRELAASPYRKGEWYQRTAAGRELQVQRSGRWLVRYWRDDPVLEIRIVDVERVIP